MELVCPYLFTYIVTFNINTLFCGAMDKKGKSQCPKSNEGD